MHETGALVLLGFSLTLHAPAMTHAPAATCSGNGQKDKQLGVSDVNDAKSEASAGLQKP
jgi:hypothetical protein